MIIQASPRESIAYIAVKWCGSAEAMFYLCDINNLSPSVTFTQVYDVSTESSGAKSTEPP